jgi:type IV fimbrial biogenesis protein FimT
MKRSRGLTLLELIICLLVLSVTLAGVSRGWRELADRARLTGDGNQIVSLIWHARAEAVGRGPVLICAIDTDCRSFGVTHGLMAIVDLNDNGRFDPGEPVLASLDLGPRTRIRWRSFRNRPALRLDAKGTVYHQNGHFMLCRGDQGQKVIVSWRGRFRTEKQNAAHVAALC